MTARLLTESADPPVAVSNESDFIIIMAALLCALICVVGLAGAARCAWIRRRRNTAPKPPNRGLKKQVLQSLPKFTYAGDSASSAAAECAICLAEYAFGDEVRVLPRCGHGFHASCVDTWLGSHNSCPSCRGVLVTVRCKKCGEIPMGSLVSGGDEGSSEDLPPETTPV